MSILSRASTLGRARPPNTVYVSSPLQMAGALRSDTAYVITGNLDWSGSGVSIQVPPRGLYLEGVSQLIRSITVTDDNYFLFTSPPEGSGNLLIKGITFTISGTNSGVYNLTDATGFNAVEVSGVNYLNCTSLGQLTSYRQGLEENTGRFGGTPELTLSGSQGGFRISVSIVRSINNMTALFKAGPGLVISGRFVTDINCDLPAVGALLDFSPSNFSTEELLQLKGCIITRQGIRDDTDLGILPNINDRDIQSLFKGNTGVPNTKKYIQSTCTATAVTSITTAGDDYVLLGTMTPTDTSHLSMPTNGEYEVLSGSSLYSVSGEVIILGNAGDTIAIKVKKSTDGGVTYPSTISTISRVVNNISGPRDLAFVPLNFIATLNKGDRVRLEVENVNGNSDVTMELGSFITIKED